MPTQKSAFCSLVCPCLWFYAAHTPWIARAPSVTLSGVTLRGGAVLCRGGTGDGDSPTPRHVVKGRKDDHGRHAEYRECWEPLCSPIRLDESAHQRPPGVHLDRYRPVG